MTQVDTEKLNSMKATILVGKIYLVAITIMFIILSFIFVNKNNKLVAEIEYLTETNAIIEENNNYIEDKYNSVCDAVEELTEIMFVLDEENQELAKANDRYYNELEEFKCREELYNKYEYALYDKSGKRTDITFNQLKTLEDLIIDSEIKDEDLILALIMTESRGVEKAKNPTSTAKGYGQFLDGTSKYVYKTLLENKSWNSGVALEGETNIKMMVAYIDDLLEKNDYNLYNALKMYRGKEDISSYVASIDSYLKFKDKSVEMIGKEIKRNN